MFETKGDLLLFYIYSKIIVLFANINSSTKLQSAALSSFFRILLGPLNLKILGGLWNQA